MASVISSSRPDSVTIGMKTEGGISPMTGWFQRAKTSNPATDPSASSMSGWKWGPIRPLRIASSSEDSMIPRRSIAFSIVLSKKTTEPAPRCSASWSARSHRRSISKAIVDVVRLGQSDR